jgi:hypothetical protein
MLPFKNYGPIDCVERKALVIAGICCLVFIGFISVVRQPAAKIRKVTTTVTMPMPIEPTKLLESDNGPVKDSLERQRVVPANFKHIDFKNRSYGPYSYTNEKEIDLKLKDSELLLPSYSGWFSLKDVYYKDLTDDGKPEAIVRLSHVQCGVSCDGGSDLFYIYTQRNGKLKTLWQYETGSYGYGCGLASFTVTDKQLVVELFGRCPKQRMEEPGSSKFLTKDLTFILFEFDGERFKQQTIQFFDTSPVDVKDYEPSIYFF